MLAAARVGWPAQEGARRPDIGSSAGTVLRPADQRAYGEMMLSQLRNYDYILADPLVDRWMLGVGNRLAAASDHPKQVSTFFMMVDRPVTAMAPVRGYIAVNWWSVLVSDTEAVVPGVSGTVRMNSG